MKENLLLLKGFEIFIKGSSATNTLYIPAL